MNKNLLKNKNLNTFLSNKNENRNITKRNQTDKKKH